MQEVDVLVVGAGPAGSAAATILARAGVEVLLCDRHEFPRDKPCGDLIGARALGFARDLGIDEETLQPYPRLAGALLLGGGQTVDLTPRSGAGRYLLRNSDARIIPRRVFDTAMVQTATRAGARLQGMTVREVGPWQSGTGGRFVTGKVSGEAARVFAKRVVIAGGYGCQVAADVLPSRSRSASDPPKGIAMRGYVAGIRGLECRIAFCLDDWMLPGYGWIFPLPDGGANAGVGTLTSSPGDESLRDLYDRFISDPASPVAPYLGDATPAGTPRSWPLDLGPRRRQLAAPGLVVAGEAAGLVGPLTGAGIAFALESGSKAGRAIVSSLSDPSGPEQALHDYARQRSRRTLPWLRGEYSAQRWLSNSAHVGGLLANLPRIPGSGALGARLLLHLG